MFELVSGIVLVDGISLEFVNATVKVANRRPALSFGDDRIGDRESGVLVLASLVLEIVGQSLAIIVALLVPPVRGQTIPSQSPGIVDLNALSELVHPAQLVL